MITKSVFSLCLCIRDLGAVMRYFNAVKYQYSDRVRSRYKKYTPICRHFTASTHLLILIDSFYLTTAIS